VVVALVAALTVVLWRSVGPSAGQFDLDGGAAWFGSEATGDVVLLDGSTGKVRTSVHVSEPGQDLEVSQAGMTATVANRTTGTLTAVSPALWTADAPIDVSGGADPSLALVGASNGEVWALTRRASQLQRVQLGKTTTLDDEPVPVPANTSPAGIESTDDGTLWVASDQGEVRSFGEAGADVQASTGAQGPVHLVMVQDEPVLVDQGARRFRPIDPRTGAAGESSVVDAPSDVSYGGSSTKPWLMAVGTKTGSLLVIDTETSVPRTFNLGPQSDTDGYGAPVEAFGKVLVPDLRQGQVIVVDPERPAENKAVGLGMKGAFRLLSRDGRVYFDQPDGDEFGVVLEDLTPVKKSKAGGVEGEDLDTSSPGPGTGDPIAGPSGDPTTGDNGNPTADNGNVPPTGTPPATKPTQIDPDLLPTDKAGKGNTSTTKKQTGGGGGQDPPQDPSITVTPGTASTGADLTATIQNLGTNTFVRWEMPGADPAQSTAQNPGTFRYSSTGNPVVTMHYRKPDGTAGTAPFTVVVTNRTPLAASTNTQAFAATGPHAFGPNGEIIGTRNNGGPFVGTILQPDGGVVDIPSPNGFEMRPMAINNQGLVVGESADGGGLIPFRWTAQGGSVLIPEPAGREAPSAGYTVATDVNSSGSILLKASIGPGSGQFSYVELYVLAPGSNAYGAPITVPGFRFQNAVMDDQGRIAATIEDTVNGFLRAVWFTPAGVMTDLAPGNQASVSDMNDNGQILGNFGGQAVVWNIAQGNTRIDTGFTEADSINNNGLVAGYVNSSPLGSGTPLLFDLVRRVQVPLQSVGGGNACRPASIGDNNVATGTCGLSPLAQGVVWAAHVPGS